MPKHHFIRYLSLIKCYQGFQPNQTNLHYFYLFIDKGLDLWYKLSIYVLPAKTVSY